MKDNKKNNKPSKTKKIVQPKIVKKVEDKKPVEDKNVKKLSKTEQKKNKINLEIKKITLLKEEIKEAKIKIKQLNQEIIDLQNLNNIAKKNIDVVLEKLKNDNISNKYKLILDEHFGNKR